MGGRTQGFALMWQPVQPASALFNFKADNFLKTILSVYSLLIQLGIPKFQTDIARTSLVAQWLRLCAPNAGSLGSIPGQGTRCHMAQ